jgi:hypothetical protein
MMRPPPDLPLPSPPPMALSSDTRPPPPLVLLTLCLPPAVAVAIAMAAVVAVITVVVVAAAVAAAALAVRLLPDVAKARAALPGPCSTTLGLAPSTCGRPVHGSSFIPSTTALACLCRHTIPWPSDTAGGGLVHTSPSTSPATSISTSTAILLDIVVYGVGPAVPCQLLWHEGALLPQPLH